MLFPKSRTLFTSPHLSAIRLSKTRSMIRCPIRQLATQSPMTSMSSMSGVNTKKEGDISSVFMSLSGAEAAPLPDRFAKIKNDLIRGHLQAVAESWTRLLKALNVANPVIKELGPKSIPSIDFKDISGYTSKTREEIKATGCVVIRGVISEEEARGYKNEVDDYVRLNPTTKAFPAHDPQVYELYWSPPQIKARAHPNMLAAQRLLLSLWDSKEPAALLSLEQPVIYADRVRIRQPGDASFALGPHVDGGSVERWEPNGYGIGGVYNAIFRGEWEKFDSWDASARVPAVSDLYHGGGSCSMFRMFQGWLAMSHTAPFEGTLMVNPLLKLTTAYFMLRPFFEPKHKLPKGTEKGTKAMKAYLSPDNWQLIPPERMTTAIHGAYPSQGQEMTEILHPHLDLANTMVHMPKIKPGDYVAWHCDTIHAVDKVHGGKSDSSVLYIPACPLTVINAEALKLQREAFQAGVPAPDFPGGVGESEHIGRPGESEVWQWTGSEGMRAMGLAPMEQQSQSLQEGEKAMFEQANNILGFEPEPEHESTSQSS